MTLEECFRICRTAVSDNEVEEALGVLSEFINRVIEHTVKFSDIDTLKTLGTLVRQLAIHKDDMDARIPLAGLEWTSGYRKNIEGWEEANSAVEKHKDWEEADLAVAKHKDNEIMQISTESSYETFTHLSPWMIVDYHGNLILFQLMRSDKNGAYMLSLHSNLLGATVRSDEVKWPWDLLTAADYLLKDLNIPLNKEQDMKMHPQRYSV